MAAQDNTDQGLMPVNEAVVNRCVEIFKELMNKMETEAIDKSYEVDRESSERETRV